MKTIIGLVLFVCETRSFSLPQHLTKPPRRFSHSAVQDPVAIHSELLGDISRIRTSDDDDDSFLASNAVPTFAARGGSGLAVCSISKARGLEGVSTRARLYCGWHSIDRNLQLPNNIVRK
jgi:hypothetical protein